MARFSNYRYLPAFILSYIAGCASEKDLDDGAGGAPAARAEPSGAGVEVTDRHLAV